MSAFADLVRFLPVASGTGDWVVSSAVGGCQMPALANVLNGVSYKVYAVSSDLTQWEISTGLYNSGTTTFPRTTVLYNSSGTGTATGQSGAGTKISFNTIPQVSVVALAEDLSAPLPNYIGGLTLSNDSGTPNSVLDIKAGGAADSTNAVLITIGAFTKSTAGSWASGSGSNGMGNGLTITASTWYHVMLANNNGIPDIWFDTSPTGANRPIGITDTKYRRLGSFRTDASSHILAFTQTGNVFIWFTSVPDVSGGAVFTAPVAQALTVPSGIKVIANILLSMISNSATSHGVLIQSPDQNPVTAGATNFQFSFLVTNVGLGATQLQVGTNTSSQVEISADIGTALTIYINTVGWTDFRGET
jgi:hypothetical protein